LLMCHHPAPRHATVSRRTAIHLARGGRGGRRGLRLRLGRPRKGRAMPGCTLGHCSRRPPDPSLLVIEVPQKVGRGRRRHCISNVLGVSDLCFKCFIWMLQK
jgi:hypothetical protein